MSYLEILSISLIFLALCGYAVARWYAHKVSAELRKQNELISRGMAEVNLVAAERIVNPPLIENSAFEESDREDPAMLQSIVLELEKLRRHANILAAIYAQDKAHVKALYASWQNDKKKATIYKPGSVQAVKATRRAALARKEWKAANTLFLKHFGDYAP